MFLKFLYAPLLYPEMLWIVIPVIFSIILMDIYFHRYPREGLGHHISLENTIFLIFIYFNLLYYVFNNYILSKMILVVVFLIFSLVIAYLDYMHKLPTKVWLKLSSKALVAYISYVAIVLVYSDILVNLDLLGFVSLIISASLVFLLVIVIAKVYESLEPKEFPEIEHFLSDIEKDIKRSKTKKKDKSL